MTHHNPAETFVAHMQNRMQDTFMELIGIRLVEVSPDIAVAEIDFTPRLQQLTGVFHAGALTTLADSTATFACLYWMQQDNVTTDAFPFTIQLSTNFIRNTGQGTVRAESTPIHRGRTTMIVETRLTDADSRLLIIVSTTHLIVS